MNTKLLILLTFLESTDAFLASNEGGHRRVFGLNRLSNRATSTTVIEPVPELSSPAEDVNVDLLGNRASEWFMPRIGGLTSTDIRNRRNRDDDDAGSSTTRDRRNPIQEISSAQDFDEFMSAFDDGDHRLSLVLFHANFCKTCQRFKLRYDKIANLFGDNLDPNDGSVVEQGQIRLASIEYTANIDLCESLDVEKFPSVHFIKGGKKINEMAIPPEKFDQVQKAVEEYLETEEFVSSGESDLDNKDFTKTLLAGEELLGKVLKDNTKFASS